MSTSRMMKTACVLLIRQEEEGDDYGNSVLGEPVEVETTCALQQRDRDEPAGEGETSVTEWNLFLPYGTDINTGDAVRVKGRVYELVGDPWDADEGSRALWHVAATCRRVSGAGDEAGS